MIQRDLTLRPAATEDCERVYEWANEPTARAMSFSTAPITLQDHVRWYEASLRGARTLYIVEQLGRPVGLVRLEKLNETTAEIGISLAPEHRGRGLAARALRALCPLAEDAGLTSLIARIRNDNARSRRLFESAGFRLARSETVDDVPAAVYTLPLAQHESSDLPVKPE